MEVAGEQMGERGERAGALGTTLFWCKCGIDVEVMNVMDTACRVQRAACSVQRAG